MTDLPDLSAIPTIALLAEVDRRAKDAAPPEVLFFGVWPGTGAGHHIRVPCGDWYPQPLRDRLGALTKARGSGHLFLYPPGSQDQPEGKLWHWYHPDEPLTLLLSWDRSGDRRHGSVASFVVLDHVTPEYGLELARAAYPRVFERIEAHLGRPVMLAGPTPVTA